MIRFNKLLVALLILNSCTSDNIQETYTGEQNKSEVKEKAVSFQDYIKSLDQVTLPFKHSISGNLTLSKNYNKEGFEKYKHSSAHQPVGVLFKNNNRTVLMDYSIGDLGLVPFLTSFDNKGNKIDSLGPFKKSGYDMGYQAVEYLTITPDKKIFVLDSVKNWAINEEGDNIVEGTMKLTVDSTFYEIKENGKFSTIK